MRSSPAATGSGADRVRGDQTRELLLTAAVTAFALEAPAAVSTRRIAQQAGVNQALIGYHFGGKEGLYRAVLEHTATRIGAIVTPLLDTIEDALAATSDTEVLAAVHSFTDGMLAALLEEESSEFMQLVLREQQDPTASFPVLLDSFMTRTGMLLTCVAGRLQPHDDAQTHGLTAISLMGQLVVFRTAHAVALHQLDWDGIDGERLTVVQHHVRRNVTAILEGR